MVRAVLEARHRLCRGAHLIEAVRDVLADGGVAESSGQSTIAGLFAVRGRVVEERLAPHLFREVVGSLLQDLRILEAVQAVLLAVVVEGFVHLETIAVGGRALTIIDNKIVPDAANRFDLFKDILLYRSRETLAERLLQLGVDPSVSTLGRFEDKIAFVLGAKYPDETVNQLWVDKDTLLPLRLIIHSVYDADSTDKVEIRYLIWWKIGESRYPSKIEFYQGDNLARVSQAKNFEENAMFSEELFDIEHLESIYPRLSLEPIPPGQGEEPSEIQKTIEDFKRIFE